MLGKLQQLISITATVGNMIPRSAPNYQPPPIEETSPMEGMAGGAELEQYRHKKGAFYVGRVHPDHDESFEAGISADSHVSLVAKSRSGKGTSFVVQNALRWGAEKGGGGLVAVDPKGEIASFTAMRRGTKKAAQGTGTTVTNFVGRDVAILDPFNQTIGPARTYRRNFNPLSSIDITARDAGKRIKSVSEALIVPEQGSNAHFSTNAETIVSGAIEFILVMEAKEKHNLIYVRRFLNRLFEDIIDDLKRCPIQDGLAMEAIGLLEEMIGGDEAGSFKSTLSKNLKWLSDTDMRKSLCDTDFSLETIIKNRGSVYIVIPPNRVEEFASWIRIVLQQSIDAKTALGTEQEGQQTLFLIDEFPLLGRFKIIERGASYLAGYNIKFFWAIQNIGQLKELYGKLWETFFSNSDAIIIFATNDLETEEYLTNRMNKIMKWITSYSVTQGTNSQFLSGGANDGKSVNQGQQLQAVRLPNEIHEQAAKETNRAFIIPASGRVFTVLRQPYYEIKQGGIYDSPQFCVQWMKNHKGVAK